MEEVQGSETAPAPASQSAIWPTRTGTSVSDGVTP
jgi:hypothetical protein